MATVYAPPAGFEPPDVVFTDGKYDHTATAAAETAFIEALAAEARKADTGETVGQIIRFPVADGFAQYMVWKERPLQLVHLALGDAWTIPASHARGLKLADVKAMVDRDERIADLFRGEAAWFDAQPLDTVLHYDNGFQQYVRCVVVEVEGEKRMRPIALVGNVPLGATVEQRKEQGWNCYDIVRRHPWGEIAYGHHARKVLEGDAWRPSTSCIVESPDYSTSRKGDAATIGALPAIDFDALLPELTPELLAAEARCRLLNSIRDAANDSSLTVDERLANIRTIMEAA